MLFLLQSCNEDEVKVIKSEAWNDLMPGSGGKTHILITIALPDDDMKVEISELIVEWNDKESRLQADEYSFETMAAGDSTQSVIKAAFVPRGKDVKSISVKGELISGKEKFNFSVDDIELENVY